MKLLRLLLTAFFAVTVCLHFCFAQENQTFPQRFRADGFVFCPDPAAGQPVPVYVGLCNKRQVGTLNCGEKVEVLSRHDDMLAISSSERPPRRLVPASAISRQADKFVPFDDQSGIPEGRGPDCTRVRAMEPAVDGFVFCANGQDSAPAYLTPCESHPVGSISCGEKVSVISRNGDMLRVRPANGGMPRLVPSLAVSQQPSQMVPFGDDSGVPDHGALACAQPSERNATPPRLTYSTNPEFTDQARRKKVQGVVLLSVTVGADGLPHDIKVDKGIGYGLDEKAVEAVSRWRFDPARKDGQPIDKEIKVEVQFRLY